MNPRSRAITVKATDETGRDGTMTLETTIGAGWQPDPQGRHDFRYFDGSVWTAAVSDQGVVASDPIEVAAGWYPDPGGTHQLRYWDGSAWQADVSDAGQMGREELAERFRVTPPRPAPRPPEPVGGASGGEIGAFIGLLLVWCFAFVMIVAFVGGAVAGGQTAYTQAEADRINSEASGTGQLVALGAAMIAIAVIAPRTGYRSRDAWMLLIPIYSLVVVVKLLWRLACQRRHYWAPAPT